jgi:hypothetical protein
LKKWKKRKRRHGWSSNCNRGTDTIRELKSHKHIFWFYSLKNGSLSGKSLKVDVIGRRRGTHDSANEKALSIIGEGLISIIIQITMFMNYFFTIGAPHFGQSGR